MKRGVAKLILNGIYKVYEDEMKRNEERQKRQNELLQKVLRLYSVKSDIEKELSINALEIEETPSFISKLKREYKRAFKRAARIERIIKRMGEKGIYIGKRKEILKDSLERKVQRAKEEQREIRKKIKLLSKKLKEITGKEERLKDSLKQVLRNIEEAQKELIKIENSLRRWILNQGRRVLNKINSVFNTFYKGKTLFRKIQLLNNEFPPDVYFEITRAPKEGEVITERYILTLFPYRFQSQFFFPWMIERKFSKQSKIYFAECLPFKKEEINTHD